MGGIELPAEDLIGSGTDIPNSRRPQQFLPQYGLFDQPLAGATLTWIVRVDRLEIGERSPSLPAPGSSS